MYGRSHPSKAEQKDTPTEENILSRKRKRRRRRSHKKNLSHLNCPDEAGQRQG
jgi:hypothetical protein